MSASVRSLADADWLKTPTVRAIFDALGRNGEEVRVVGGAVRNALMGRPVTDVDFATSATPDRIAALAEAAGIKAVPTGVEHGTLTLVVGGHGYEVTTLREDVETDGRHAVVRFGRDWVADALRRDFTVNALSVDQNGVVHDPLGSIPDIEAKRIRFIGSADQRIAEDRLRILRFFRFTAEYAREIDPAGLAASIRARDGLRGLSAERIGHEMRKLVVADRAAETLVVMQQSGILPVVLSGVAYTPQFARLVTFEAMAGWQPTVARRLAVLGCSVEEDALRIAERLRLRNADRDDMLEALSAARSFKRLPGPVAARALLYRLGSAAYRNGVGLAFAWSTVSPDDRAWRDVAALPDVWPVPSFPLRGHEVANAGVRGPAVGELLRTVETWWIEHDFRPGKAELRSRLQQLVAGHQQ